MAGKARCRQRGVNVGLSSSLEKIDILSHCRCAVMDRLLGDGPGALFAGANYLHHS